MKELLAKLSATARQVEALNARQTAALEAAEKDGAADDDRAKHLAEFDRLQAEKEPLERQAAALQDRVNKLAATNAFIASPARPAVSQDPTNPHAAVAGPVTVPARARRHGPLKAYRGADGERDAYAAGLWFAGALFGHGPSLARAREHGMEFVSDPAAGGPQANLTGLSNQSGGFFVPEVIETTIIEVTQQYGVLRRLAEVVPMTSDTLTTPRWSQAMVAYWIGRGQKPASSDPAWNAVQLIARDLGAMTKIGRQINEDSLVDLAEKVTLNIARAFQLAEDNAGFNGDGTSAYGGIVGILKALLLPANANCVKVATGHTTPAALTNADFLGVLGAAPNYAGADWRWLCHKQVYAQSMANLQLVAGGNRVDTVAGGPQQTYLGYPVEFVNVMPAAPASGQIGVLFADLSMAVKLGDRRGRTVQAGYENDDFTRQLVTLLGTERVDVNVHTVADPLGDANAPGGPVMALQLG